MGKYWLVVDVCSDGKQDFHLESHEKFLVLDYVIEHYMNVVYDGLFHIWTSRYEEDAVTC